MSHRSLATWLLLLSLGIVGIGGCGSGSEDTATTEDELTPTEEVAEEGDSVPVEPFSAEQTAPETEPRTTAAPAGLINSTNPDERAQEVQSRINNAPEDPFDVLPVELVETLEPPEELETVAEAPQTTGGGGTGGGGTTTTGGGGTGGGGTTTTGGGGTGGGGTGGGTTTTGGGGTGGGGTSQPAVSLPPLPPTVAQVAEPIPDISPLFVPPNDNAIALLSPSELGISEPEGAIAGTPDGAIAGTPDGAIAGTPAAPANGDTIASEPGELVEEAPLSLPPLDGEAIAELPPLPTEIGPAIPPPPPVPPTISENVEVTGVVEVGGEVQVIVQLPGSSSGRYVRVGDVIAGGRVLVKRVEGIQGTNPIVILEEDGSEYPRFLGEAPRIAMEDSGMG